MITLSPGQSAQLMEPHGGEEWDQTGAEATFHLHAQPVVPSHTVTTTTEGPLQQSAGRLQQFVLLETLWQLSSILQCVALLSLKCPSHLSWWGFFFFPCIFMSRTGHADPPVVDKHGSSQRVLHPEQAVAEYFQQGAGLCSVLNATGWWSLTVLLIVVHLLNQH